MSTVKEAIEQLNEKHCHPAGFHVAMHSMDLFPEEMTDNNAMYNLMTQTFDWRYEKLGYEQAKVKYTVKLTKDDIKYIGNAMEVYNRVMFEMHIAPAIERMVKKIGEEQEREDGNVS